MMRRKGRALAVALAVMGVVAGTTAAPTVWAADEDQLSGAVSLPIARGKAIISTANMAVEAHTAGAGTAVVSAPVAESLGPAKDVQVAKSSASWTYPDSNLAVKAETRAGRLVISVHSTVDQSLRWPVTGVDSSMRSLQIPNGEGLSLPVDDPLWNSADNGLDGADMGMMNMPFWGYSKDRLGISYISPSDIGTSLSFKSSGGRLNTTAVHDFSAHEDTRDYVVTFALTDGSPIGAAKDYRRWLLQHHQLRTLAEKAENSPEIAKLRGAFHAYVWGTGRSAAAMNDLRKAGVGKMLVSWDSDKQGMPAEAIQAAKRNGYLAGPYDTWANAQPPETADAPTSKWPAPVWDEACIRNAQGQLVGGFGGRGCYLSSQALAQAEPTHHYIADRIATMTADHPNAYFLDVDSAGDLFTDHTPAHPMNQKQDLHNRLERMGWLSKDHHLVVGGEAAGAWSNSVVDYSHGSASVIMGKYWKFTHTTEWGQWSPGERPTFFFKPATMPDALRKTMWDPRYRAPLYATVLHDSIVNLDRWELSYYKVNGVQKDRALLAMVSANPLNFALDESVIREHGAEIATLQKAFEPLHRSTFDSTVTDFRYLGSGTQVQQSTFGDGSAVVTANFSDSKYRNLPAKCATIAISGHPTKTFCP